MAERKGGDVDGRWWRAGASRIGLESADVTEQRRRQRIDAAARMLNHLVAVVVWIGMTIAVFHLFDIDAAFFLSSAGFIGAGVAIGGQHKVNDYLTGLSVLFEDRYGVGDELVVDMGGREPIHAVVDNIGLVTTRLRDERSTIHVPNAQLTVVRNLSQEAAASTVRLQLPDGADADVEQTRDGRPAQPGRHRAPHRRRVRRRPGGPPGATRAASTSRCARCARSTIGRGRCWWSGPRRRCGPAVSQTASRERARAARWRRITRRSSSDSPPQTPESWFVLKREVEAVDPHRALAADLLGPLDLGQRRPRRADGEEQLGIGVPAQRMIAPAVVGCTQGEA